MVNLLNKSYFTEIYFNLNIYYALKMYFYLNQWFGQWIKAVEFYILTTYQEVNQNVQSNYCPQIHQVYKNLYSENKET